jgi:hypothetical protein
MAARQSAVLSAGVSRKVDKDGATVHHSARRFPASISINIATVAAPHPSIHVLL